MLNCVCWYFILFSHSRSCYTASGDFGLFVCAWEDAVFPYDWVVETRGIFKKMGLSKARFSVFIVVRNGCVLWNMISNCV